jgi:hypothetical protein
MRDWVKNATATQLDHGDYLDDFFTYFKAARSTFLKLERRQCFKEPDSPSWRAFDSGDWRLALELINVENEETKDYFEELKSRRIRALRIRIVEFPIDPYLQWEFWVYHRNARLGEDIRVITLDELHRRRGQDYELPELAIIDDTVAYEVMYDDSGLNVGGRKIVDQILIRQCTNEFMELFNVAQPIDDFFPEHILPLSDPV